MNLPRIEDVRAAADRIAGVARNTPLLRCDALDEAAGATVWVKAECLQPGGAFKLRGAVNAVSALGAEGRKNGVLAYSSGNHAIAVATAAKLFGVPAVIVMPADAPRAKLERTRSLGAEVVTYDRVRESREEIGQRIARERALPLVKPFDDPFVMAGQGTIGLELAAALPALDAVFAPASGGGLAGGIATALPGVKVYAVEPAEHDDIARSLAAGTIVSNAPGVRSICDALLVEHMSELTFAVAKERLAGAVSVTDEDARRAMRFAFEELKLVLEPSGATSLAAVLTRKADIAGKTVAVVASGGNVDAEAFAAALTQ